MSHAALVQEEGIASLYKGIRPTLLGIMPYASWQEADVTEAKNVQPPISTADASNW